VKLLEPVALVALVAVVAIAVVYVVRLPFRRRYVITLPTTGTAAAVAPRRPGWRRHVSTVLFLATLVAVVVAFARPARDHRVPRKLISVIVVLDTSNSMRATDVKPQRLVAASRAALQFADRVPRSVRVGLVTFAGTATIAVSPTSDRDELRVAIDNVEFADGTSLGDGILAALTAVDEQLADLELTEGRRDAGSNRSSRSAVVLLSDGQETLGTVGQMAVDAARRAKIPVSTIAYGTKGGVVTLGSARVPAPVDRTSLAAVAADTRGEAFVARPSTELDEVYDDVAEGLGTTTDTRDLTPWALGIALVLGTAALFTAFTWGQRVP
jgi:Ca-activated chloride channel family protein